MYLVMKTFHIFTLIVLKISGMAAALQHLQKSHPHADKNCAGGEGPSSPNAPRPYVQALCAPFNCNQRPHSSLMAISRRAAGEPSISEGGNCLNLAADPQ
jgi:hypothetical protein